VATCKISRNLIERLIACAFGVYPFLVHAQSWPAKPLHLIVPLAYNRATTKSLPYDAVADLTPIGRAGRAPNVLVVAAAQPMKAVADLIAYSHTHPNSVSYATIGEMSPALIFTRNAHIDAIPVLYKGGSQTLTDLLSMRVTYQLTTASEVLPLIAGNRLHALGVTGESRFRSLPNVPTLQEAGILNLTNTGWWGIFAPAKTPDAVVNRLSDAMVSMGQDGDVVAAFDRVGIEVAPLSAKPFKAFLSDEIKFYGDVATEFHIQPQ
jgi:tripartite-type tricarboxylate transporter receptor subunit TctC